MNRFKKGYVFVLLIVPLHSMAMDQKGASVDLTEKEGISLSEVVTSLSDQTSEHSCLICWDTKPSTSFYTLGCNHTYCFSCFEYMADRAITNKSSHELVCPNLECKKKIERDDLQRIVKNADQFSVLSKITQRDEARSNPLFKVCPIPDCHGFFIDTYGVGKILSCLECQHRYCSACLVDHKQNISCEKARRMKVEKSTEHEKKQIEDEAKTVQWIQSHSKACPRCNAPISKKGGCQKVRCKNCFVLMQWNS